MAFLALISYIQFLSSDVCRIFVGLYSYCGLSIKELIRCSISGFLGYTIGLMQFFSDLEYEK